MIITCDYFDHIININDLNLYNISLDEKAYEIILLYDVEYKYGVRPLRIIFNKVDGYFRKMIELKFQDYFILMRNMRTFLIELDIISVKQ